METNGRTKRRRTRQEVEELLCRYEGSGLTVREFSDREKVAPSSLYKWLRRGRTKTVPMLVEVTPAAGSPGGIVVRLPQGYDLEVPASFSTASLKQLLLVLES